MTIVAHEPEARPTRRPAALREIRVALLGLGQVGSALAELSSTTTQGALTGRFRLTAALVRDPHKPRRVDTTPLTLLTDGKAALASTPDVVVEVLGGIEPARTLVLAALDAGIPVVTANKTLLAYCGTELAARASAAGVPFLYEASVLAGVPFLGALQRRPLAGAVTSLRGIVNGTSNYVLSRIAHDRIDFAEALAAAQRAGYAEADPAKDVDGDDAVEKLCVLLRQFAGFDVHPSQIEKAGIGSVEPGDQEHAAAFGGCIRPLVAADWPDGRLTAYAGPAYIDGAHAFSRVDGVQNAVALTTRWSGELLFSGPGAGPVVTAATVLDDVVEAVESGGHERGAPATPVEVDALDAAPWFLRLTAAALGEHDAPALLSTLGVRLRRASHIDARGGHHSQRLLTHPCARAHIDAALDVLAAKTGSRSWRIPVVE